MIAKVDQFLDAGRACASSGSFGIASGRVCGQPAPPDPLADAGWLTTSSAGLSAYMTSSAAFCGHALIRGVQLPCRYRRRSAWHPHPDHGDRVCKSIYRSGAGLLRLDLSRPAVERDRHLVEDDLVLGSGQVAALLPARRSTPAAPGAAASSPCDDVFSPVEVELHQLVLERLREWRWPRYQP